MSLSDNMDPFFIEEHWLDVLYQGHGSASVLNEMDGGQFDHVNFILKVLLTQPPQKTFSLSN